jgi:hypothetical protein
VLSLLIVLRQSAVVRGAALRGLEGIAPRAKRARRHYGFRCGMLFREGIDPEDRAYIRDFDDLKCCGGRVEWLVAKASNEKYLLIPSLLIYRYRARRSSAKLSERVLLSRNIHPARLSSRRPCCTPVRSMTLQNIFLMPVRYISILKMIKN